MTYQDMLAASSADVRGYIIETDASLKFLHSLKFKRTVDKKKINYVSSGFGVSYAIFPLEPEPNQQFGWYFLHDKETKTWYRKKDYFEEILAEIAKDDPESAKRIFDSINECTSCKGNPCSAIPYIYDGTNKSACYGRIKMPLHKNCFADIHTFFIN